MPSDLLTRLSALRETLDAAEDTVQNVTDETARDELISRINDVRTVLNDAIEAAGADETKIARMTAMLVSAKEMVDAMKAEISKLTAPPSAYGYFIRSNDDETVDIFHHNQRFRVNVTPAVKKEDLKCGARVIVNEALNVVAVDKTPEEVGFEVKISAFIGEDIIRVTNRFDEVNDCLKADALKSEKLKEGDVLLSNSLFVFKKLSKSREAEGLALEKIPEITFNQVGGLKNQIEALLEAIEYPALYPEHFKEHKLKPSKGILLYGPPGCGKTLMAKAVANRLARRLREKTGDANISAYFLNVKGPELLNKYVGETERKIREVFQRAKEKATEGCPVIIFFDEFESLFRTRGSGISSDMEATIVPQFLSMMDGVEELHHVIVIGASNRQDLIDPAVLRPGRFDLKIKIDRPDKEAAGEIFSIYVTSDLPWGSDSSGRPYIGQKEHSVVDRLQNNISHTIDLSTPELMVSHVINVAVDYLYYAGPPISWTDRRGNKYEYTTECVEITWATGDKKKLHVRDILVSGAMIDSIVNRVKKMAIKRLVVTGKKGITKVDFYTAIRDEIRESSDLPNTNNPDDWAKIVGQQSESGSRIVNVRFLGMQKMVQARRVETVRTGHYL